MQEPKKIAQQITDLERFRDLTLEDLGLSIEEMMVAAIEADRAQRVAGENETLEFDGRFPDRPMHPDFARLSSAVSEQDAVADALGVEEALKVDEDSLLYLAKHRVGMYFGVRPMNVTAAYLGLYFDAFQLGVGFAERGGHRPAETGTAGEGSSS